MGSYAELSGKTFGKLHVICLLQKRETGSNSRIWKCECECGAETESPTSSLTLGRKKSCGKCDNHIDATNQQFHDLKALHVSRREVEPGKRWKTTFWMCECKCGNQKEVRIAHLRSGLVRSCGCLHKTAMRGRSLGCGEMLGFYWGQLQRGAMKRNLEFTITREYAWELFVKQGRKCALSGRTLVFTDSSREFRNKQTASLDRIDSRRGYCPGNVCWVHKDFNALKSDWGLLQLIQMCKELVEHDTEKTIVDRLSSWGCQSS